MFVLNSEIQIGDIALGGVHEATVKRSLHSFTDTATLKLPSKGQLQKTGRAEAQRVTTGELFFDGDAVSVQLGYNGELQEEFKGFVKRRNLNMPLDIECEGYSYLMRRNTITQSWKKVSVKELLQVAVSNFPRINNVDYNGKISVICTVDIELINMQAIGASGAEIVDAIIRNTDNNLSIFFVKPDVLWCGLVYTPYAGGNTLINAQTVDIKLGWNVIKENGLKEREKNDNQVNVVYAKKTSSGQRLYGKTGVEGEIRKYKKFLNRIATQPELQALAQEKIYRENYTGYEGYITAFLQPYALPGYIVNLMDDRYKTKNGKYLIESTEVTFGMSGARRKIEIGPKVGFDNTASA